MREVRALRRLVAGLDDLQIGHLGETETLAHASLGELVPGLNDVAALMIPYARLPTRASTAFGAEFLCWADIAGQTVDALLSRRNAGAATVRAVLAAALDVVAKQKRAATSEQLGANAAVQRLLSEFDERDHAMLSARVWAQPPQSHDTVAQRLGVTKVWVIRHQSRAEAKFAELLADPIHREVRAHAEELGRRLGPYLPAQIIESDLHRLGVDPDSDAAHVLLHLAGPYAQRGEWCENTAISGEKEAAAAVDDVFARCPAPSTESLLHALIVIGMPLDVTATYVRSRADWRRFGDVWVRWGDSVPSKIEAVLYARGTPATPAAIFAAIGPGPTRLRAVREALYRDQRFVRASLQTWGLRAWAIDEYAGSISREIAARIDAAGGTVNVDELITDMRSRLPDVAESSIRTNLSSLAFINDGAVVRRRNDSDEWPAVPPLYTAQGAFYNGHNEIRLAMPVNADVLRGSGRPIHPAVAHALDVGPGQRRVFTSPQGPVPVIWRLSSTSGPSIGSLRALANDADADPTDILMLVFKLEDGSLDATRIGADVAGVARLRKLLGRNVRSPGAALTASLGCKRAYAAAALRERGDDELADLVED